MRLNIQLTILNEVIYCYPVMQNFAVNVTIFDPSFGSNVRDVIYECPNRQTNFFSGSYWYSNRHILVVKQGCSTMGRSFNHRGRHFHLLGPGQVRSEEVGGLLWLAHRCHGRFIWVRVRRGGSQSGNYLIFNTIGI